MDEILTSRNCVSFQKESELDSEERQITLKKKLLNFSG